MQPLLVLCACPTREHAQTIARSLVEHHLAACVNLLPAVKSIYRWQGSIETAEETLLLIKTRAERLEELKVHVLMLHPYELPEILAVEAAGGLPAYLAWVAEQTREND